MKPDIKPIKRSSQLAPLSREHHNGLLFVWKLRQGLSNGTTPETLRDFSTWFWNNDLETHFEREEKIIPRYLAAENSLAMQLRKEHDDIRALFRLVDKPDAVTFAELCNLLEKHIRFEERVLFPHLEDTLSTEEKDLILVQLEENPVCSSEWENKFWERR